MINWQKLKKSLLKTIPFSKLKKLNTPWMRRSIGIISLCTLLILTVVYVKRKELKNLLAPPSPQTISENLLEKTQAINQIIFHQFSKLSINEDHTTLKQFQREDGLIEWNYSVITVTLSPSITFNQVKNAFKRGFAFFEIEELNWHFFHTKDNCLKIDVSLQGFKTHQLIFSYPSSSLDEQKTTKDVYQVSIVIDDLGEDYKGFKKLLAMNIPFTCSILPFQTYSTRIAHEAHEKNREIILHLPLEPWDNVNQPTNYGTLLTSMKRDQLLAQLERDINAVPHIAGISNHMGSKFTEDRDKMEMILKKIKKKGLYYLDSRTTKKTVGYTLAKEMKIKAAERDLFIDNSIEPLSIEKQLKKLPLLAKKNGGYAIAIGHPHPSTIDTLKKTIPYLKEQGVTIVPLSQLVK
jgi:polysaccharide deacetylase 2 family uncharacterized protein YibQ